jgi:hypothetical protein
MRSSDLDDWVETERESGSCCRVLCVLSSCLGVEYRSMGPESGRSDCESSSAAWTCSYGSLKPLEDRGRGEWTASGGESRAADAPSAVLGSL